MFHKPVNKASAVSEQKNQSSNVPVANENQGMNNPTSQAPKYSIQPQQLEDTKAMNIPQNNAKADQQSPSKVAPTGAAPSQGGRVDIPGGAPGGYPGYAGGTQSGSYTPQTANDPTGGRKLVISEGITLSGEIESCDHLVVEGTVEAALKGANAMDISESGAFYGTVEIEEATIAGRFEGDLSVKGRLTIRSTGVITGSIAYKELSVEAGAVIEGSISPLGSAANSEKSARGGAKGKKQVDGSTELPFTDKTAVAAE